MNATAVKKAAPKSTRKVATKTTTQTTTKAAAIEKSPTLKAPRKVAAKKATPPLKAGAALVPSSATPAVAKSEKVKIKLVRDSFTMPAEDWALIAQLKERALGFRRTAKKSELLRAGLQALAALPDAKLKSSLDKLLPLKPGRPKIDKK